MAPSLLLFEIPNCRRRMDCTAGLETDRQQQLGPLTHQGKRLGTANPRLIDVFGAEFTQDDVDFAIPRLEQDIPLYVDPFLLWASDKPEYKQWHAAVVEFCHRVAVLSVRAPDEAKRLLAGCREEAALGLGYGARSRNGRSIGPSLIAAIVQAHQEIPQLRQGTLRHLEELQLVVPKFAEDMVSDVSTAIIKPLLLDFTVQTCANLKIPTRRARVREVLDPGRGAWIPPADKPLPFNPVTGQPLLLVPLDILRHLPWINYSNYFRAAYTPRVSLAGPSKGKRSNVGKPDVLAFNARNYVEIERYVSEREALKRQCHPDPLFQPLATNAIKARIAEIKTLPTGKSGGVDRRYEDLVHDVLASAFFPTLEFAESKVRTISGAHIRDLIFYNDAKTEFWKDVRERYDARQPVFELKNVAKLETEHVNQLHRYLDEEFGRFGILVTRNPVPPAVQQNIVDLHSSKRVMILCLDDRDIEFIVALLESGRDATDICKRKYIELTRLLPK